MLIEIASGDHKLIIDSNSGGKATQWFIEDLQILGKKGEHPLLSGCYLMAPWAGRIKEKISCDEGEFPAELGWHPWFQRQLNRGQRAKFAIEATSQYVKDENLFTLNETKPISIPPFDDAFHVPTGKGFIEWPHALRINFTSDVDTFVVYDELDDLFCIEPQTGPPDAINHPRHLVNPQNPLEASVKWEVISL